MCFNSIYYTSRRLALSARQASDAPDSGCHNTFHKDYIFERASLRPSLHPKLLSVYLLRVATPLTFRANRQRGY